MIVDYQSLKNLDVARLSAAQQAWARIGEAFSAQQADYEKSVQAPVDDGTWTGTAASAAKLRVAKSHDKLVATSKYLESVRLALTGSVSGMSAAKVQLDNGLRLAAEHGVAAGNDGLTTL